MAAAQNRLRTVRLPLASFLLALAAVAIAWTATSCSGSNTPSSASGTSTISGTVTDAVSGAAVTSATVTISGKSATTGSDGKYTISGLANGSATLTATKQGERNFSQSVTVTATTTQNIVMTPAPEAAVAGTLTGTWVNNTFGTTGPVTVVATVDTVAQTYSGTITFGGNVFGQGGAPAQPLNGAYSTTANTTFSGTSSFFGTVNATVTPTGAISGTMTSLPASSTVSQVTFAGSATTTTVTVNYTVTLRAGGTATGVVTLTKS